MKSYTYSKKIKNINIKKIWDTWTDINQWHTWQNDLDSATINDEFKEGSFFYLKPKGGPKVKIELIKVIPHKQFIDLTKFPLAKMYGDHQFIMNDDELEIKTTMTIKGPLAFLWDKIVVQGIADKLEEQTEQLIKKSR